MKFSCFLVSALMVVISKADDKSSKKDDSTASSDGVVLLSGSQSIITEAASPTGSYISYASTITVDTRSPTAGSMSNSASTMAASNGTATGTGKGTSSTSSTSDLTTLVGGEATSGLLNATSALNATGSNTSSSPQATNTTPCNNYVEFCFRKYSNITMVAAHNSPFVGASAADNQVYDVTTQLNDGIRLLQGQTHKVNGTLRYCHTNCDILDAGPIEDYLTTVYNWVNTHPYDIVTIILENGDYVWVENFTAPLEASGLVKYAYLPPKIPMGLDDWPTLASMILTGKRVVLFMDYNANQASVPYILDEFSQLWESPFDPTDRNFPCPVDRPPGLSLADAQNRMYMTNHNLNTNITILDFSISVPTTTLLNVTNNVTGFGSLGEGAQICYQDYGRAPNFLNVDYYNVGDGSVFEVAAKWNNVTYNTPCCGTETTSGAGKFGGDDWSGVLWSVAAAIVVAALIG